MRRQRLTDYSFVPSLLGERAVGLGDIVDGMVTMKLRMEARVESFQGEMGIGFITTAT